MSHCDVLTVDDEEDYRVALRQVLTLEGLKVADAASGAEAMAMLIGGLDPAVVLIDFRMPGWSGYETLQRMRSHGLRIPAVLVSADKQAVGHAKAQGFADSLAKPYQHDELMAILLRLIGSRSSALKGD